MKRSSTIKNLIPAGAAFAALMFVTQAGGLGTPSEASAAFQPENTTKTPPFNSTEDRKAMVAQLSEINNRLAKIEARLNAGLSVKVTEMPAVVVKESPAKK